MPTSLLPRRPGLLLVLLLAVACRGRETGRGNDTAGGPPSPPPPTDAPRPTAPAWDTTTGVFFAIPAEDRAHAFVIDATYDDGASVLDTLHVDTMRLQRTVFDLFSPGEVVGVARIAGFPGDSAERCPGWPFVTLAPASSSPLPAEWRIAFAADRVRSAPFDSLPTLAAADSTTRVVALARAASTVEGDTAAAFRGRPFVVRQANRVTFEDREILFAEVVRTVHQEANPLQEQLLLVVERADAFRDADAVRFADRAIALEDVIESVELVAAIRSARTGVPGLLLRRESEAGTAFVLLQRAGDGAWFVRWRSAAAGC